MRKNTMRAQIDRAIAERLETARLEERLAELVIEHGIRDVEAAAKKAKAAILGEVASW